MLPPEDPSVWRSFRKTKQLERPVGRPRKHAETNEFYGYPAPLIAEWCCVAPSTAHAYRSGRLKPSKPAAQLFRLVSHDTAFSDSYPRSGGFAG